MAPPAADVLARVMDSNTEDIYDFDYSNKDEQDTVSMNIATRKVLVTVLGMIQTVTLCPIEGYFGRGVSVGLPFTQGCQCSKG